MQAAKLDHDLGLAERPQDDGFDEMMLHVDGWLCEIKDVQIRDGLHVLGAAPQGDARVDLVLAMLRARQIWGGEQQPARPARGPRARRRRGEGPRRRGRGAGPRAGRRHGGRRLGPAKRPPRSPTALGEDVARVLRFAADARWCPRLAGTAEEIPRVLHALDGGFIPAGPSGSPLRGLVNVLPTGRNFYSVDPKAVPSRLAWETGQAMAESLVDALPRATTAGPTRAASACRCGAPARCAPPATTSPRCFALLGVRPVWDEASRRVAKPRGDRPRRTGPPAHRRHRAHLRLLPRRVPARPGACSTTRCSWSPPSTSPRSRTSSRARTPTAGTATTPATMRIFGSKPGTYGAGLLQLDRLPQLARRRRPRRGLLHLGRLRLRPRHRRRPRSRRHGGRVPADRGRGEEHRHPRARHRRLRRLLPVPRRHGRDRPGADRRVTGRLRRRLDPTRRRSAPAPCTRRPPASSAPAWSTRAGCEAMRRHGYKGAFEMAATVDYLFGWDATTGVVADWSTRSSPRATSSTR